MTAIAPTGESAIHASLDVEPLPLASPSITSLSDQFDIPGTIAWILDHNYKIIGLQFPDALLHLSIPVFHALRKGLPAPAGGQLGKKGDGVELYIMADTTYGSCCVDEVAAMHVGADAVIHYGSACMTSTARLPVLYIFPRAPLSEKAVPDLANSFFHSFEDWLNEREDNDEKPEEAELAYDVTYDWIIERLYEALSAQLRISLVLKRVERNQGKTPTKPPPTEASPPTLTSKDIGPSEVSSRCCSEAATACDTGASCASATNGCTQEGGCCSVPPTSTSRLPPASQAAESGATIDQLRKSPRPLKPTFYLGPPSRRLTHLLLTTSPSPVFSLDPSSPEPTATLQTPTTNRLLMRRYGTVQRARDADTIGIVVGTLGIAHYLPLLSHLRQILAQHRRKSYTVAVGKLRPEKLANFAEVECWVLVGCPENSLLDGLGGEGRSKEYPVPVVTPFELEIALASSLEDEDEGKPSEGRKWDGSYVMDFGKLLRDAEAARLAKKVEDERTKEAAETSTGDSQPSVDDPASDSDSDAPVFSTATGKYIHRRRYGGVPTSSQSTSKALTVPAHRAGSELAVRNANEAVATVIGSAAGVFGAGRSWRGLETRRGMDEPAVLEMGRDGVARGYGDDHPIPEPADDGGNTEGEVNGKVSGLE